jgi:23S rRNA (guanosine2251-2'-O)-methyltransferase
VIVYGINPVREALRSRRVREVRVAARSREKHRLLLDLARQCNVAVRVVSDEEIERDSGGGVHQGVLASLDEMREYSVEELVSEADGPALIVVLDGIEDPQNLGAILRSVDAAGAHGVVMQSRRSAALAGAAAKASAGAISHVKVAQVVNIARALEDLKKAGVWVIGLAGEAAERYDALDMTGPTAIVLGAEGTGIRRLVRESCDFLAKITMRGHLESLNVSVAAGIVLFEAVRQRSGK